MELRSLLEVEELVMSMVYGIVKVAREEDE
jgi:hypothetical protein